MKFFNIYLLATLFSKVRPSLTPTKKICRDCKHFIGDNIECAKFGETNIITGRITYETARSARKDETKCGENAVHFEENRFKIITVPYYYFKYTWPAWLPVSLLGFYLYSLFYIIQK